MDRMKLKAYTINVKLWYVRSIAMYVPIPRMIILMKPKIGIKYPITSNPAPRARYHHMDPG